MVIRRLLGGLVALFLLVSLVDTGTGQEKKDPPAGDKAKLEWKFKKDAVFFQSMTTKTEQTMNVLNNDVKQTQTQTFHFQWKVLDDPKDDKVKIEQKIIGVKMDIDIGNQKITYDSTDPKNTSHPLADFFKALVGSTFTLTLDTKTMKVTEIAGREKFVGDLVKANASMKPLLEQILSDEALKQMAEPTFAAINNGQEVSKGGQPWKRTTKLNMGPIGSYENDYTYTYEGKDDKDKKLDKIKVVTTLKYTAPPADNTGGGLPFKIKSAQLTSKNAEGFVYFNGETGRIDHSDMSVTLEGTLSIEIGGQTTEVKLNQKQESTVTTSDKSPVPEPKTTP